MSIALWEILLIGFLKVFLRVADGLEHPNPLRRLAEMHIPGAELRENHKIKISRVELTAGCKPAFWKILLVSKPGALLP